MLFLTINVYFIAPLSNITVSILIAKRAYVYSRQQVRLALVRATIIEIATGLHTDAALKRYSSLTKIH